MFGYIRQLLYPPEENQPQQNGDISLTPVTGIIIYPNGMTTTLSIPHCHASVVEKHVHKVLGVDNRAFHMPHRVNVCHPQYGGAELWHDTSLYQERDCNQKATQAFGYTLYGRVVVLNRAVDPECYDSVDPEWVRSLSRAHPPAPQSPSSPPRSTQSTRSKRTSLPPTIRKDSKRRALRSGKGSSSKTDTSMVRPVRRSRRLASRKR